MYTKNKVNLIGFLGGDAEVRNANNRSFTTLSLATKSSYKDKKSGQYVAQTEWHRCVVFGKLAEFAGTLTKSAHVQIEGELRSREYTSKITDSQQRIWEIRVDSILKLDRAEKAGLDDQDVGEEPAPWAVLLHRRLSP
jgi:single-strand DNA-binding protein